MPVPAFGNTCPVYSSWKVSRFVLRLGFLASCLHNIGLQCQKFGLSLAMAFFMCSVAVKFDYRLRASTGGSGIGRRPERPGCGHWQAAQSVHSGELITPIAHHSLIHSVTLIEPIALRL